MPTGPFNNVTHSQEDTWHPVSGGACLEHSALAGSIGRKHEQAQKERVGKLRQMNLERAGSGEHDQNLLENSKLSKN